METYPVRRPSTEEQRLPSALTRRSLLYEMQGEELRRVDGRGKAAESWARGLRKSQRVRGIALPPVGRFGGSGGASWRERSLRPSAWPAAPRRQSQPRRSA
jgi:hypothetical protein